MNICLYNICVYPFLVGYTHILQGYTHILYTHLQPKPLNIWQHSKILKIVATARMCVFSAETTHTGWLKLQVIFRQRATGYRALLQKTTHKDKASYGSSPPCTCSGNTFLLLLVATAHMCVVSATETEPRRYCNGATSLLNNVLCHTYGQVDMHIWMNHCTHAHTHERGFEGVHKHVTSNICTRRHEWGLWHTPQHHRIHDVSHQAPWNYRSLLQNIVSLMGLFCKRDLYF